MKLRFAAFLAALCLLFGAASAAPPDMLKDGFTADLTGEVKAWSPYKGETLAALKHFFSSSALRLTVGEESGAALLREGLTVLALQQGENGLWLSPTDTLYSGSEADIVSATGVAFPKAAASSVFHAPDSLYKALNEASAALPAPAREVKGAVDFKGAGRAHTRKEHVLSAEEWRAFYARFLAASPDAAEGPFSQAAPDNFVPEGEVTLKRFFAKSGEPLGWTVGGMFSSAASAPQKALIGFAKSSKGVYASLQWGESANLSFNMERKKDAVKADGRASRGLPGLSGAASLRANLSLKDGLRGSLSLTLSPEKQKAVTWTMTPKLSHKADGRLEGTIGLVRTEQKRKIDLIFQVSCSPGVEAPPAYLNIKDAAAMTEKERESERTAIADGLARAVLPYVFSIPESARSLVLHELGQHLRVNGGTPPPVSQQPPYLVKEDPQP